jgi:hypothetical protein
VSEVVLKQILFGKPKLCHQKTPQSKASQALFDLAGSIRMLKEMTS